MTRRDKYVESITSNLNDTQKPFWNWINKMKACLSPIPSFVHNSDIIIADPTKSDLLLCLCEDTASLQELQCHLTDTSVHLDTLAVSSSEVFHERA